MNPEPAINLKRILLGLLVAVALFDLCFWKLDHAPGLCLSFLSLGLGAVILLNRPKSLWRRTTLVIMLLLVGAAFASAIETGFSNTLVLLILILVLAGETYFTAESCWGRWFSQGLSLPFAPGRLIWLTFLLLERGLHSQGRWLVRLTLAIVILLPTAFLFLLFSALLSSGNLIFGLWLNQGWQNLWAWVSSCLDFGRFIFWFFSAFLILPLLQPVSIPERWWKWTEQLPRFPEILPTELGFWSSALILFSLNLLFLFANGTDAAFLWSGVHLPEGVTYSEYVHHGVNALILTVLLSALVLTTLFQQSLRVAGQKKLKLLAILWVMQNLFLLMSVALRLQLYVNAYGLSVLRLSLMTFLLLVFLGYLLLVTKIVLEKSLSWLLGGLVLATFGTFYLVQFLDFNGWTAEKNVARWQAGATLDVDYLQELGSAAWPALRKVADNRLPLADANNLSIRAELQLKAEREMDKYTQLDGQHWRSWSLRAWWNRSALEP